MERANENSLKIRKHFIETYNQFLNNFLSTTLLEFNEKVLNLKNRLIKELKNDVFKSIREKINKNYSNYIKFLLKTVENVSNIIDKPLNVIILLNSKDFNYFNKNPEKVRNNFQNSVEIRKSPIDFIGGFKVMLSKERISYDYSIDNLIDKNSTLIQQEFSKIIEESEIKEIESNFEDFIHNQKLAIEKYLNKYDQI